MALFSRARVAVARGMVAAGLLAIGCEEPAGPEVSPPTLELIAPGVGNRSSTVPVLLSGTGFSTAPTVISVSGSGVTAAVVVVHSETQLGANFTIDASAPLGGREVTVTTGSGTSSPQTFAVRLAVPTLQAVTPNIGVRGAPTAVTLTGTDFVTGGTTVAISGSGITVSGLSVTSSTTLTANFVIDAGAAIGDRTVTVTTVSGTGASRTFTVNPQPPTLASISPATGVRGATTAVTVTGTNFISGGTTVAVSGSDVSVTDVSVASATSLTANLVIGSGAALGARDVTVGTVGGTSAAQTFTVNPVAPTLTAVSPATGVHGNTVAVTLTGTNFISGGTTIAVSGSSMTVSNVSVVSGTSLTADFAIGSSAALGDRNVTVTTAGGTTSAKTFAVNPPPPTLTAISPTTGVQGTTVSMTLTGTNFVSGATVAVSGSNVTVSNINVVSATSITADFAVGSSAALGDRNVTVTTSGGTTSAKTFTVNPPAPTLTAVSPTTGVQGTTVAVTLTGTNFVTGGTTVTVSGSNVTVSNVSVSSGTSLTADFTIAGGAALGDRNVTVTTAGGTTGAKTFTVNPPAPTLTSISPTSGVQGNTVSVTLTGTNFVSGATVAVSGSNVTVSNVSVSSATSLTADFAVGSSTALGDRNVTVTTAGGTTATKTFTVNPPAPTLTSVSPSSGVQGTTVSITLTGTNFVSGATTVAVSGSNVTVQNVSVSSGTSLTAQFVIATTAAAGARNVTVTTAGGTSGAQTFTVNASAEPQVVPVTPSRSPSGQGR